MFYNISEIIDKEDPLFWSRLSPVNCNTIRIIGIFLCIGGFIGIILNGFLVYSFVRYKKLRNPANIFVMLISIIGLLSSFIILPSTGISSIYCYWLFNRIGCQFEAIMAFLYGCSSSYLLCAVSLSRCYIVIKPFNAKNVTV
jgi:r-opsin